MTLLLFVMGIALVVATARLLIYAAVLPRIRLANHLRQIEGYGFEQVPDLSTGQPEGLAQRLEALAEKVGRATMARFPMVTPLRRGELSAAAFYEVSAETVHGYRVIGATLATLLMLFCAASAGWALLVSCTLAIGAGLAGFQLPALVIRRRGRARLDEIDRDLPDLIDLLTATMEAGLGFPASIELVSGRFKGALGQELRLTQQQQQLGIAPEQALEDMVERCDTPSMRAFVRTLRTAESMGVSIGPSMRELARDTRRRRRQTAEERIHKAPVKMMIPLMVFIFPALMIVLLYPAAYSLLHTLSHS